MHFSQTLRAAIHPPWKDQYIDYAKLKSLLREDNAARSTDAQNQPWTEDDENAFCDEILNVQLEKVAAFQANTFKELSARADRAGDKLRDLAPSPAAPSAEAGDGESSSEQTTAAAAAPRGELTTARLREVEEELDSIVNEMRELKKYSTINYTGFLKIVKKHDRKRGSSYKIRPMVTINLARRPFNSEEGYAPLANRLSVLYWAVRERIDGGTAGEKEKEGQKEKEREGEGAEGEKYNAYKFWIHQDNLLEVKTFILRRLPVLVYSKQASSNIEAQGDPTLNSLYFDNSDFALYNEKVSGQVEASSLRVRWYGQLSANPELVIEHKIIHDTGSMEEKRFPIKEKYIQPFIKGNYAMEKSVQKMERQGQPEARITTFKSTVKDVQAFINEHDLQPVLRANYTRTAFQKPLDDKVRISIDTNVAFIREDAFDADRPCRDPDTWHRTDVDNSSMAYPFPHVNRGEISLFPHAILEIKVREDGVKSQPKWIEDLMASHLVHKAPGFSKFVHGVAALFEDHVNSLPFWISEVETDIRKDPQAAFDEEEQRKAKSAEADLIVGSLLGTPKATASYKAAISSPLGRSFMHERLAADEASARKRSDAGKGKAKEPEDEGLPETTAAGGRSGYGTLSALLPSFSMSRYAQARREKRDEVVLPPGVTEPTQLIKDSGPLQVEPKVWLANERTFLKWQHISILLGGLAVGLYTAAGGDFIAELMGVGYILIAVFAATWGYFMHFERRNMIVARSGKDFDNFIGPLIVSAALMVALILNFAFKYKEAMAKIQPPSANVTMTLGGERERMELF